MYAYGFLNYNYKMKATVSCVYDAYFVLIKDAVKPSRRPREAYNLILLCRFLINHQIHTGRFNLARSSGANYCSFFLF